MKLTLHNKADILEIMKKEKMERVRIERLNSKIDEFERNWNSESSGRKISFDSGLELQNDKAEDVNFSLQENN